jgi:FkbM family methyltransferase
MVTPFTLKSTGGEYKIFLPASQIDHIQKIIVSTKEPYEPEMLKDIGSRLKPGDLYLDIGANIGNHTLYVASLQCKVISFEPNSNLADVLKRSVAVNGYEDRVTVNNFGLGKNEGRASFAFENKSNTGMQNLVENRDGSIEIRTLDSLTFPQKIAVMKIDVEQMEMDVLLGGEKVLRAHRPIIYVESQGVDFLRVTEFLGRLNYSYWDTFNATPTHLFFPLENIESWWQAGHSSTNLPFLLHRAETRHKSALILLAEMRKTIEDLKNRQSSDEVGIFREYYRP